MQKLVSCICAVIMMISCFCLPSFSVSAYSVDYDLVNQSFDDLINNYNLSSTDISASQVCYFSGYSYDKTVYCSTLWVGSTVYRIKIENGEKSYYTDTKESKYPILSGQYVGYLSVAAFYYSLTDTQLPPRYQLTYAIVNDADLSLNLQSNVTNYGGTDVFITNYSGSGSLGDMAEDSGLQNSPAPDPTEPVTSGGFELPQDWIDGGHTLETVEPITFEGVDPSAALDQFESMQEDVDLDESFGNGVGLFWAILEGAIDSMGIWSFVVVIMIFVIIRFVLGR